MSSIRSYLSTWTFWLGVLAGCVVGGGGLILVGQYMASSSGDGNYEDVNLEAPDVPERETLASYGTVPTDWTLHSISTDDSTTFGALTNKPVLVNAWATWCGPCKAEMPSLQALHDTAGAALNLALVSPESRDKVRQYIEKEGYSMPVYVADELPSVLQGRAIPRTFLIRPDRQVVFRHVGTANWNADAVHGLVERLASSTAPSSTADKTARNEDRSAS